MRKILLLASMALFLPAAPAQAQVPAPKVLVVITDLFKTSDLFGDAAFDAGLYRALQFKQAGMDVRILFEGSAVLAFLDLHNTLSTPAWQQKVTGFDADLKAQSKEKIKVDRLPKYKVLAKKLGLPPPLKALLQQVIALNIPYTLSSAAAQEHMVLLELQAAGEPLSPDPANPVDLSDFIKQGYRIVIY